MYSLARGAIILLFLYLTNASTIQKVHYGKSREVKGLPDDREMFIGLKHSCKDMENFHLKSKDVKNPLFIIKLFSGDRKGLAEIHLETMSAQKGEGRGINVQIQSESQNVANQDFDYCGLVGFKCYQAVEQTMGKSFLRCSFRFGRSTGVLPHIELQDDLFMESIEKYSIYVVNEEEETGSESDDLTFAEEFKRGPVNNNILEFTYNSPQRESEFTIENEIDPTIRLYGAGGKILGEVFFGSISLNYGFMAYIKRFSEECSITEENGAIKVEVNGAILYGSVPFCANWNEDIQEYSLLKGSKPGWI